jgi:hypothetical protein
MARCTVAAATTAATVAAKAAKIMRTMGTKTLRVGASVGCLEAGDVRRASKKTVGKGEKKVHSCVTRVRSNSQGCHFSRFFNHITIHEFNLNSSFVSIFCSFTRLDNL